MKIPKIFELPPPKEMYVPVVVEKPMGWVHTCFELPSCPRVACGKGIRLTSFWYVFGAPNWAVQ